MKWRGLESIGADSNGRDRRGMERIGGERKGFLLESEERMTETTRRCFFGATAAVSAALVLGPAKPAPITMDMITRAAAGSVCDVKIYMHRITYRQICAIYGYPVRSGPRLEVPRSLSLRRRALSGAV